MKRLYQKLAIALCTTGACPALVSAQEQTYSTFTVFENQPVRIFVNSFPVLGDDGSSDGSMSTTQHLNQVIVEGENELRIELTDQFHEETGELIPGLLKLRLERGPRPDDERIEAVAVERQIVQGEEAGAVREEIELRTEAGLEAEAQGTLDGVSSLLELHLDELGYRYGQAKEEEGTRIIIRFHASEVPLTSLPWTGEAVALTNADREEIRALITSLHTHFTNEDSDLVLDLISNKTVRFAEGLRLPVPQMEENLRRIWQMLFDSAGFSFHPLELGSAEFHAFPDANLVEVTAADGSSLITGSGGTLSFELPIFVSKLEGTWTIVD